jgi:hypothetical protein
MSGDTLLPVSQLARQTGATEYHFRRVLPRAGCRLV